MLTQTQVQALFIYDPAGHLIWRVSPASNVRAGAQAGSVCPKTGRRSVRVHGISYRTSRVIWVLAHGDIPSGYDVDHQDTDVSNERLDNLRLATDGQNSANRGRPRNNTSGFKGIRWLAKPRIWHARIMARGIVYEDWFKCLGRAIAWRKAKAIELHGEFARHR